MFFPKEPRWREECREIMQRCAEKLGLDILGFRKVPVRPDGIGEGALSVEPEIEQVFIASPSISPIRKSLSVSCLCSATTFLKLSVILSHRKKHLFTLHRFLTKRSCIKASLPLTRCVIIILT
ncbi:hypothetical protein [Chitinophaga sedimenti]|uniref:hypothetical protein n=1 Tax=Chitinophaga sedimenti TaxID=2033606 RepID=UPI0035572CF4